MIDRVAGRFDLHPKRLAGDTAYGAASMLAWLVKKKGIAPHIPVFDRSRREDGTFSRADFTFDAERDLYLCPRGKTLTTTGKVHDGRIRLYRASTRDCGPCPLKRQCCPKTPQRKIPRDIDEDARDVARALYASSPCEQSRQRRPDENSRNHPCLAPQACLTPNPRERESRAPTPYSPQLLIHRAVGSISNQVGSAEVAQPGGRWRWPPPKPESQKPKNPELWLPPLLWRLPLELLGPPVPLLVPPLLLLPPLF